MASWEEPIFDRNAKDVNDAKIILNEWRVNPPSEYYDLKGCFNASDLNRIEGNAEFIKEALNSKGCKINITTKTNWAYTDTPIQSDIDRVISNINTLHDNLPITDYPTLPSTIKSFEDANAIEKALERLHYYLDYAINRYSDTFESDATFILPIN